MSSTPPDLELKNISIAFGANHANDDVSFAVAANSIHGVVGENGAGKSTVMKIVYGLYQPDSGEIRVRGETTAIANPHRAIALGIGMVHQHFMLVPPLPVWQNVILGSEPSRVLHGSEVKKEIGALQKEFGFTLDLDVPVEDLPVGQQQQVEILKLLYRKADILILDEPTAVLTPPEVDHLFARLKHLWEKGKTIILISHKLREILEFTQNITVMRAGKVVQSRPTAGLTENELAELIVGRKVLALPERHAFPNPAPILSVSDLTVRRGGEKPAVDKVSFQIRQGEILGIAGVSGNGQEELIEVLANVIKVYEGEVAYLGKPLAAESTYRVKQSGLSLIPPNRGREAIIYPFSVEENFLLGHHREKEVVRTRGWFSPSQIRKKVGELITAFDVRPRDPGLPIRSLSGGNQQKVVVGRETSREVKLLIAAHPTRGVDVGAIEFIHSHFLKLRDAGAAILLISSELEEVLALSDRILVMYGGRITGEVSRQRADLCQIGKWMTGILETTA